jgi:hypothetical protein
MQQGRVQLDADWNEQVEIQNRLRRAAINDVIGRCCVPQTEPESFRAAFNATGQFEVRAGRIWVDGKLYQTSVPLEPDIPEDDGRYAVYLEVWERHVTAIEDPDIREIALGGPDTTTRTETIGRIGFDPAEDAAECSTEWTPPEQTTGTLTATTAAEPTSDPCIVPTGSGYTRLENQLYRVEVHRSGTVGGAVAPTFKWSRENAWPLVEWLETDGDELLVADLGRDEVVGFHDNRWIELEHDGTDLSGTPGLLVEIIDRTPEADGRWRLRIDAHGQTVPDAQTLSHPKARCWNQDTNSDPVSGDVEISVDEPIPLEGGIRIEFSPGFYRAGDYWLIPARTFVGDQIGSILWPADEITGQPLAQAPHGVERSYCRIAYVTVDDGAVESASLQDCRSFFPSLCGLEAGDAAEGCCTVVVQPGEDIQAALDSLPVAGGCVCLKPGLHQIDTTLRIENSNVELRGEAKGAIVRQNDDVVTALSLGNPAGLLISEVVVNNIQFEFDNSEIDGSSLAPLLDIDRCEQVTIRDCRLSYQRLELLTGVRIGRSSGLLISHCDFDTVSVGVWVVSDSTALSVLNNRFRVAPTDIGDAALVAVFLEDAFGASRIEANEISGYIWGIALNRNLLDLEALPSSGATGTLIAENRITRSRLQVDEIDRKIFAIDVAASGCLIQGNLIRYASDVYGGIQVFGNHCRVAHNSLFFSGRQLDDQPAIGIQFGVLTDENTGVLNHGRIQGNRISGPQHAIVVYQHEGIAIEGNHIDTPTRQVGFAIVLVEVDRACVADNRVSSSIFGIALSQGTDNHVTGNELREGGAGVSALSQTAFEFSQNRIEDMRNWGFLGLQFIGKTSLTENRIVSCGYDQTPAIGIGISGVFGDLHVESCEVMNTGVSPDEATIRQPAWGIFADLVLECLIQGNIVTHSNSGLLDISLEDRALWLRGLLDYALQITDQQTLVFGFSAQVANNKFLGPGFSALVEFQQLQISDLAFIRFQSVLFHNNFLWHMSTVPDDSSSRASVVLRCREFSMTGCHVKATTALPSVDAQNRPGIFMGNITTGGTINFAEFPNPETGFNR